MERPRHTVPLADLLTALEQVLSAHFGARRRVKTLRRRKSAYSSSSSIENLEVELDGGLRLRLVFKDLSPGSLLPTARRVRPPFLYDPAREIEIYRKVLGGLNLGTPVCYGAFEASARQIHWLFLERVTGPLLWQVGRMTAWEEAGRWLARLHTGFESTRRPQRLRCLTHLLRYDRHLLGVWISRAEEFLRRKNSVHSSDTRRRFAQLAGRYERVVAQLTALPKSFIHGEFYPSNILLRRAAEGWQICPIDWELGAFGPGLMDLAALTSGDWPADNRQRMATAYRAALEPAKGWPPPLPELMELIEHCQLHLAVQWLGWAADWSPPELHARNWLRQALRLAERLGL